MRTLILSLTAAGILATALSAQQAGFDRLSPDVLDVLPPSARIEGAPGAMTIRTTPCRSVPTDQVRRRIVEIAVQEWAFFGFSVVDRTVEEPPRSGFGRGRGGRRGSGGESARTAASIAGYWSAAPGGDWILDSQNDIWTDSESTSMRWRYPWSAAFISWVMCEGGLGEADQFQRAIAHHVYIDQAIRARDGSASRAAFAAYDAGEAAVEPGDLLCTGGRPAYRTLAERRRQMGQGARTHCDVVVKVDEPHARIMAIGGNVRGTVGLKLLPAEREAGGGLLPMDPTQAPGERVIFAHLKLRAAPIESNAFDQTLIVRALGCESGSDIPAWRTVATQIALDEFACGG